MSGQPGRPPKPHIRRYAPGRWVCRCRFFAGDGVTPRKAYNDWLRQWYVNGPTGLQMPSLIPQ
jgi:hypothetical protein